MIAGLYLIMLKTEKYWDLMHYICSCIRGTPLFLHEGTDAYIQWQDNDRYALHSAAVTVLVLTGPGGPPEHAYRLGTVAQRCTN